MAFCTPADVLRTTGYTVDAPAIIKAQAVIEVYIGKIEADVELSRDLSLLNRATCFQSAYMFENGDEIYQQVALSQTGNAGSLVTFKAGDFTAPWVSPLAVMACRKLSWLKSRSVHTGRIFQRATKPRWVED